MQKHFESKICFDIFSAQITFRRLFEFDRILLTDCLIF